MRAPPVKVRPAADSKAPPGASVYCAPSSQWENTALDGYAGHGPADFVSRPALAEPAGASSATAATAVANRIRPVRRFIWGDLLSRRARDQSLVHTPQVGLSRGRRDGWSTHVLVMSTNTQISPGTVRLLEGGLSRRPERLMVREQLADGAFAAAFLLAAV